jgi:hypothetical protein
LHPPKMFSQFSANSWSQHMCNIHIIWKWTQTISIYLSQMFMHLWNNKNFLHSQNFEIEVLHIATKRIQTPENKFKPNSRKRKHLEFSRTLADLLTFQKPKYNLMQMLKLLMLLTMKLVMLLLFHFCSSINLHFV